MPDGAALIRPTTTADPGIYVGRIRREPPSGDGCKCLMALRLSGLQIALIRPTNGFDAGLFSRSLR
ncbi:hypothetical protein CYD30_20240 [Kosakonia cowanii]|nr:hypothetical protein CYD30_20240 [Kosakonia cowanii]